MGKLEPGFTFTGRLGPLSAYTMRGSKKVVVRTKGGMSKRKFKNLPKTSPVRLSTDEWKGCTAATRQIRHALSGLLHLADTRLTGRLNKLAKAIQTMDTVHPPGQREIQLSLNRHLLEGLNFNEENMFDSVVRYPVHGVIDRTAGTAVVDLPALVPDIHLRLPWEWPVYRFILGFSVITDITTLNGGKTYQLSGSPVRAYTSVGYTDWFEVNQPLAAQTITLQLKNPATIDDGKTLLLVIGIEMGKPVNAAVINPAKYAGCAKILAAG